MKNLLLDFVVEVLISCRGDHFAFLMLLKYFCNMRKIFLVISEASKINRLTVHCNKLVFHMQKEKKLLDIKKLLLFHFKFQMQAKQL